MKLPIKTVSESNRRDHWAVRAKRVKKQREAAYWYLSKHGAKHYPEPPFTVTLTRVAPRKLDSDNLSGGALKAVRDGIADYLGIDDGDERVTWRYGQRKGEPKEYAVEVEIE